MKRSDEQCNLSAVRRVAQAVDDSACSGHALGEACEEFTVRSNQLGGLKRRFAMKRKRAVGKGVADGSEEEGRSDACIQAPRTAMGSRQAVERGCPACRYYYNGGS